MSFLRKIFEVYHHVTKKRTTLCESHLKEVQARVSKFLTINMSNDKDAECEACRAGLQVKRK